MKTLIATSAVAVLFFTGCSSTMTVGPNANKDSLLGASANTDGVSVTAPWIKATVDNDLDKIKKK